MLRVILSSLLLVAGLPLRADDVTVFAAASLKNALDDIAARYEAETDISVSTVYAGSSVLARQVALGAPADLFMPANPDWMDWAITQGAIRADTRRDVIGNGLVLIAHGADVPPLSNTPDFAALIGTERLAVALTNAVPAGIYAKTALSWAGAPDDLPLAQAVNVRAALTLVVRGETPYGIVYASDANAASDVSVLYRFPDNAHPAIRYPAALTMTASPSAAAFQAYLTSPAAQALFLDHGFETLP